MLLEISRKFAIFCLDAFQVAPKVFRFFVLRQRYKAITGTQHQLAS